MGSLDTGAQSADLAEVDKGKEVHRGVRAVPRDQEKKERQGGKEEGKKGANSLEDEWEKPVEVEASALDLCSIELNSMEQLKN